MSNRTLILLVFVVVILSVVRVSSTRVFAQVLDEPVHVAAGFEWLSKGTYRLDVEHPPLARVAAALPLWLKGATTDPATDWVSQGNALLLHESRYVHNLAAARRGNLLFLVIGLLVVAAWTRHLWGGPSALMATLIFGSLPAILGHSGVATTDMAAGAMIPLALLTLTRWLDEPSPLRAVLLGAACGVGALSKFSFLPFFLIGAAVIVAFRLRALRVPVKDVLLVVAVAVVTVWAGYRFHTGTISAALPGARRTIDRIAPPLIRAPANWVSEQIPVPAPLFARGVMEVKSHDARGHMAFLLGQTSERGWWYYFPVALFYKTPPALFMLVIAGLVFGRARAAELGLVAIGMLLVSMTASINIGVRHLLPLYAPLAIVAGGGAWALWIRRGGPRLASIALISWLAITSAMAHPDYLPWFNEFAGAHPEEILADSNLDWGQDILRLREVTRREGIEQLKAQLFTSAPLEAIGFPPIEKAHAWEISHGWIAISETSYQMLGGDRGSAYSWLRDKPYRRVGTSIRLYHYP